MKPALKTAIAQEISRANSGEAAGDLRQAFAHLERAHILGQRRFLAHMYTHLRMLRVARKRRDAREIRGQLLRIVAVVPGYVSGWIPKGNTGGADVSPLKPMRIPDDIAPLLRTYNVWRDVGIRLALAVPLVSLYFAGLALFDRQRAPHFEDNRPPSNTLTQTPS